MAESTRKDVDFSDNGHSPLSFLMGAISGADEAELKWSNSSGPDIVSRIIRDAKETCSRKKITLLDVGNDAGVKEYNKLHNEKKYTVVKKEGKFTTYESKSDGGKESAKDESYKYMIEYVEIDEEAITKYFNVIIEAGVLNAAVVLGLVAKEFPSVIENRPEWVKEIEDEMSAKADKAKKKNKKGAHVEEITTEATDEVIPKKSHPIIYQEEGSTTQK